MAEKNIKEGDEVSWNWGGGKPSGTVAEVQTEGKLEIESKGKAVHRNADPSNPAVHVAREGNDVVKRASELTKKSSNGGKESEEDEDASKDEPADYKNADKDTASQDGRTEKVTGDKRERQEDTAGGISEELEKTEKETGKEMKKVKVDDNDGNEHAVGENSASKDVPKKKAVGRPKKSEANTKGKKAETKDGQTKNGPENTENAEKVSARTRSKASV